MIGFQIPHWQGLVDTVIEAARLMQHIPLIGWDVAALDGGPVIVELNERPDFFLPQLSDARGVLDPELTGFLATQKRKQAAYQKGQAGEQTRRLRLIHASSSYCIARATARLQNGDSASACMARQAMMRPPPGGMPGQTAA